MLSEHFHDLLCSHTEGSDIGRTTFRAFFRHRQTAAAIMAFQNVSFAFMKGHRHIAMGTPDNIAAAPAGYESGIASAVQKEHDLLLSLQFLTDFLLKPPAENRIILLFQFFPQINDFNRRHI